MINNPQIISAIHLFIVPLFKIKNDNGEEVEVYHNSQRAINESVMLVSN